MSSNEILSRKYYGPFNSLSSMKVNGDYASNVIPGTSHYGIYSFSSLKTLVKDDEIQQEQSFCCGKFYGGEKLSNNRSCAIFLFFTVLSGSIVIAVALMGIKSLGPCSYSTILSFNRNDVIPYVFGRNLTLIQTNDHKNGTQFKVALFGDSLISRPFLNLDLEGKIKSYLPQLHLEITSIASNGCKIADMRGKLGDLVDTDIKPDAVILYWDSDVSDVDESKLSSDSVDELRLKYTEDLSFILHELVSNISYVAVAGPGILGEGPMFMPKSERFAKDKAEMLNTYREMNKAIAESYGCPYIDMRQAFLDAIPSYRLNYKHCVTYDGEHENEYGTLIVADLISKTIFEWIENSDSVYDRSRNTTVLAALSNSSFFI